jgi:hypothetical protein
MLTEYYRNEGIYGRMQSTDWCNPCPYSNGVEPVVMVQVTGNSLGRTPTVIPVVSSCAVSSYWTNNP